MIIDCILSVINRDNNNIVIVTTVMSSSFNIIVSREAHCVPSVVATNVGPTFVVVHLRISFKMIKNSTFFMDNLGKTFQKKKHHFFWALPKWGRGEGPAQIWHFFKSEKVAQILCRGKVGAIQAMPKRNIKISFLFLLSTFLLSLLLLLYLF